jgi:hypothetical protein
MAVESVISDVQAAQDCQLSAHRLPAECYRTAASSRRLDPGRLLPVCLLLMSQSTQLSSQRSESKSPRFTSGIDLNQKNKINRQSRPSEHG